MATSDARRHDLYNGLDELLGTERADTLMAYLPAYETTELATREDIRRLEERFEERSHERFQHVEDRFQYVEDRFDRVDDRFDLMDDRFERVEDRLDGINQRLDRFFLTQSAALIAMVGTLIAAILL